MASGNIRQSARAVGAEQTLASSCFGTHSMIALELNIYNYAMFICCSIDGLRLEYETDLGSIFQEERDDKTATKLENDFTGLNNLPQLCRLMLRAHGVQQSLWFAHVRIVA